MEKLPIKHVPGHELTCLPGEATRTIDQGESGEATDKKGTQLHSSGADVLELQVHKLCGRSSLEAQGLGNKGMQILQAECVHLDKEVDQEAAQSSQWAFDSQQLVS